MNLAPLIKQRFFDSNGDPLALGKLYSYVAGTTTPQGTYSNSTGTANANPVVLDSEGYANVWLDPTLNYKFALYDSTDSLIWTVDNVSVAATGITEWNANTTYSAGDIVQDASGYGIFYVSLINNNQNNALTDVSSWRMFGGKTRTVSTNTTLAISDEFVRSNSTSGNITHTLPAISSTPIGKRITIKDVGTGGNATSVKGSGSDLVEGNNTWSNTLGANEYATFHNNGTTWDFISGSVLDTEIGTAKLAANAVTRAKMEAVGQKVSSSSGNFTTSSGSYVDVTNMTVDITTTGRPVVIKAISDGTGGTNYAKVGGSDLTAAWAVRITVSRTTSGTPTEVASIEISSDQNTVGVGTAIYLPPGVVEFEDTPSAGTHTYKLGMKVAGSGSPVGAFSYSKLYVREL